MSAKIFKNSRCARRHLPAVFLCIQAIDKRLKPSYLWDAFSANEHEVQHYLEELYLLKLTDHKLNVLCIDDTIFVILYDSLKIHLDSCCSSSIDLIDVSETVVVPSILSAEKKKDILNPIIEYFQGILDYFRNENASMCVRSVDCTICNPTTLFGILLGYPVVYWFSYQSPYSEFPCLSMHPLKVHKIITSIYLPGDYQNINLKSKNMPLYHELFNFSIPENVCKETDYLVKNWFDTLISKSKTNTIFQDVKIKTNVISLPSVSL